MNSMLSFVLSNKPAEWVTVSEYNENYQLFDLHKYSKEYRNVAKMFNSTSLYVNSIKRVQNPFQYGRFKLRQDMLKTDLVVRRVSSWDSFYKRLCTEIINIFESL